MDSVRAWGPQRGRRFKAKVPVAGRLDERGRSYEARKPDGGLTLLSLMELSTPAETRPLHFMSPEPEGIEEITNTT